jgi:nitrite reductase (NADH) large subunit
MERVGLEAIRAEVVGDLEARQRLVARFEAAQAVGQSDPWAERVASSSRGDFEPLSRLSMEAAP